MYKSTVKNEQDRRRRSAVFGSEPSSPERYYAEHRAIEDDLSKLKQERQALEGRQGVLNRLIGKAVQGHRKHNKHQPPVQWTSVAQWKSEHAAILRRVSEINEQIEKAKAHRQTIEADRAMQIAKTHDYMQALYFMRVARQNLPAEVYERLQVAATGLCLAENEISL